MKVVRLEVENFMRLNAVDVSPDPDTAVVQITGGNAVGKTSILTAIWAALQVRGAKVSDPIRHGEHEASVRLDLGDIVVTRKWKGDATNLTVTSAEGARFNSPQQMLDSLVGRLSFDPLAFASADGKKQRQMLLEVIDLGGVDLDALEVERQGYFDERTEVGRETKRLTALRDSIPEPPAGTPFEPVDVAEVAQRLERASEGERDLGRLREEWDHLQCEKEQIALREAEIIRTVPMLQNQATAAADLRTTLATARDVNERVEQGKALRKAKSDLLLASQQHGSLTRKIEDVDRRKRDALAAANLPDAGGSVLGITADGVTLDGVPFSQASGAQRLKASVAIAMAANPNLRVLRVADGSLLDKANMAVLEQMAAEKDYQVWCEVVADEDKGVGIHIVDGGVAS